MIVFKCNKDMSAEEFQRWQDYITSHRENNEPILLPEYFDVYEFEEGEEVEYEESWKTRLLLRWNVEIA